MQLANLMQEFVHSPDVPSETEARLRSFLSSKASMCELCPRGSHLLLQAWLMQLLQLSHACPSCVAIDSACQCDSQAVLTGQLTWCRSFPMLELYLDIVIKIYWIVMPVLVSLPLTMH